MCLGSEGGIWKSLFLQVILDPGILLVEILQFPCSFEDVLVDSVKSLAFRWTVGYWYVYLRLFVLLIYQ